jgi:FemAB-related protein (PEP-CTERM system-associated)
MAIAKSAYEKAAPVAIGLCEDSEAAQWNRYVERHPRGSLFHLSAWGEAIRAAYGYESAHLVAKRGGEIVGGLPLIDVRSPLLGRALISTAFSVGGGPLGENDDIIRSLGEAALREGEKRRAGYVEIRSDEVALCDWPRKEGKYANFTMTLPQNEEDHLRAIPKRRRAEIRKALAAHKSGALRCYVKNDPDRFYDLYARSLRRLGTPVFAKKYLRTLMDAFSDRIELSFVDYEGSPAAALLSFYCKDRVHPYYVGAASCARTARAHELLYWDLMRRAAARGILTFDFGRSKLGTGAYHFKKLWGVEAEPVVYRCRLVKARAAPDVSPTNPKFSIFADLWKRMPLAAANRLGPLLAPNFP